MEPVWREFKLWPDSGARLRLDVRHVVSVIERQDRLAYGGNQDTALIRLHDGHEYLVWDSPRRASALCAEREATR